MKFTQVLLAATALLPLLHALSYPEFKPHPRDTTCTKPLVRKEWRTLTIEQRTNFNQQLKKLFVPDLDDQLSFMDKITRLHIRMNMLVHATAVFFPWHRWLIRYVELKLQQVSGDPVLTIPYWSTTFDSQAPELSPVFGTGGHQYGLGGNPDKQGCVDTGAFKDTVVAFVDTFTSAQHEPVHKPHCFTRGPLDLSSFLATEAVMNIVTTHDTFQEFRWAMEAPHGLPHTYLGREYSGMGSTYDPIFWIHHADIDRFWFLWQKHKPDHMHDYKDKQRFQQGKWDTRPSSIEDALPGFEHIKVADVMDSEASLCVTYEEMDTAVHVPPTRVPVAVLSKRDTIPIQVDVTTAITASPHYSDRTDSTHIRIPPPLSSEWIKHFGADETRIRQQEAHTRRVIEGLNSITGFVSVSAYWNQPTKLAKLDWNTLKVSYGSKLARLVSTVRALDKSKAIDALKQSVRKALHTTHLVQNTSPHVQQQIDMIK